MKEIIFTTNNSWTFFFFQHLTDNLFTMNRIIVFSYTFGHFFHYQMQFLISIPQNWQLVAHLFQAKITHKNHFLSYYFLFGIKYLELRTKQFMECFGVYKHMLSMRLSKWVQYDYYFCVRGMSSQMKRQSNGWKINNWKKTNEKHDGILLKRKWMGRFAWEIKYKEQRKGEDFAFPNERGKKNYTFLLCFNHSFHCSFCHIS